MKDLGLQLERTLLSWHRTGVSALVVAGLAVKHGVSSRSWLEAPVVALLSLACAICWNHRSLTSGRNRRSDIRLFAGLACVAGMFQTAALLLR